MLGKFLIVGFINIKNQIKKGYIACDETTGIITNFGLHDDDYIKKFKGKKFIYGYNYVIEAGDFNAHSHPEQSIYCDIVDKDWDLPTWCRNTIYKYSPILKPQHIYLACCRAFSRMLMLGVTTVMVSFYCHNNKGNVNDDEVIKAARDTGIRLYFGRMNYDIINYESYDAKINSQSGYFETASEAENNFLRLMNEKNYDNVIIAPAIHSIHASSREAIVNAINLGNKYNKYIQLHLSEDMGDVDLSLKLYNKRPVEFLVSLLLSGEVQTLENMILSDCVWIDDNERRLIKEYNIKVVLNPRMNARIKAGEADLEKLIVIGINPYLGTDGEASNYDLSIVNEKEFLKKRFSNVSEVLFDKVGKQALRFGDAWVGDIEIGNYCDLKITKNGYIGYSDVFVGGKRVVECGKLLTLDVDNYIERELRKIIEKDLI